MKSITLLFILISTPLPAWTLKGKITFKRKAPDAAIVYLPEDNSLALSSLPVVDQKDKKFLTKIVVGEPGKNFVLKNSDSINHNIFANDKKNGVKFDIGLAEPGVVYERKIDWEKEKIVKIGCKIHPRMRAWVAPIKSKYYHVIDMQKNTKSYEFEIKDIPENLSIVKLWLPSYDAIETSLKSKEKQSHKLMRRKKEKGSLVLERA